MKLPFSPANDPTPKPANLPFTDRQFIAIVAPMFVERLLQMVVGLADTFVVSYTGEAAVSGVSLVNQFNNVFIFLSTALAAGGAVITSQYIGNKDPEKAGEAASQLASAAAILGAVLASIAYIFRHPLLTLLFGAVEPDVMAACLKYLEISAFSFPMLAIYDAGVALYRSLGQTKTTMWVSMSANVLNVIGNIIGVFILKAGVAGVAWPTLIARTYSAVFITILCLRKSNKVHYSWKYVLRLNPEMLGRVLHVAVPNGVENGVFQLVKVSMSSIVSLFGTAQIAANGISQSFWSISNAFGNAGGPGFTTVIGQCMGDENIDAAEYYFKHLPKVLMFYGFIWNAIIVIALPFVMYFFPISSEAKTLTIIAVVIHSFGCFWLFPYWGAMPCGLRAAGDVGFTMKVTTVCTLFVRLVCSYLFGVIFKWGFLGVEYAMMLDWAVRAVLYRRRVKEGKWKEMRLI